MKNNMRWMKIAAHFAHRFVTILKVSPIITLIAISTLWLVLNKKNTVNAQQVTTISSKDVTVNEADGNAVFCVLFSGYYEGSVTVSYSTFDITATANQD